MKKIVRIVQISITISVIICRENENWVKNTDESQIAGLIFAGCIPRAGEEAGLSKQGHD